jgi:hypothetical protein
MTVDRKPDLMTPTKAAKGLGVARNTVMHRIATQRYASQVVGGVTFVVVNDALREDLAAATAAA